MAPKAKGRPANLSHGELQKKAAKRQAALMVAESKRWLTNILKSNPHLHSELLRHANNLGYFAPDQPGNAENVGGVQLQEHEQLREPKRRKAPLAITDAASEASASVVPTPHPQAPSIPTMTLGSCSDIPFLLNRCKACDRVACGDVAITAMIPLGKRQHVPIELARLITFASGVELDADLSGEIEDLAGFDDMLEAETARRGNRLSYTILRPNYDLDGIYLWWPNGWQVQQRFTRELIELDERSKESLGDDPHRVHVYSNFSEQQAVLRAPGMKTKIMLRDLFKRHEPALGTRPIMIRNRPEAASSSHSAPQQATSPLPKSRVGEPSPSPSPSPEATRSLGTSHERVAESEFIPPPPPSRAEDPSVRDVGSEDEVEG